MDQLFRAKVTGKGQIQVPSGVREALCVKAGDELVFRVAESGAVYVTAHPAVSLLDLAGALKSNVGDVSPEALENAGPEAAVERHLRVTREAGPAKGGESR